MNQLLQKFPHDLVVLCFPTNQFGHQENTTPEEMLLSLRHVRPGNDFEPLADMFQKVQVNGGATHPLFKVLKEALPIPHDSGREFIGDPRYISWSPVCRDDITWNFEKFLVTHEGVPYKRYSKYYQTIDIGHDIEKLIRRQHPSTYKSQ